MALIQWIIGAVGSAERIVGANNVNYPDVINRPLRAVLAASGLDPDADFPGFAIAGNATSSYAHLADIAAYANGATIASSSFNADHAAVADNAVFAVSASYAGNAGLAINAISASYAPSPTATSASYAATASVLLGSIVSASYAFTAQNVLGSIVSASFAATASYFNNSFSSSVASASSAVSSSYALTASYALNGGSGGSGLSSSYALTASYALTTPPTVLILVTGSYTASLGVDQYIVINAGAGSASVYIPSASLSRGQSIYVRKEDPTLNPVIVDASGTDSIDGFPGRQFIVQYDGASFISDGGTQWMSDGLSSAQSFATTSSYVRGNVQAVTETAAHRPLGNVAYTASLDMSLANSFQMVLTGSTAIAITNPPPSGSLSGLLIEIISGSNFPLSYPASFRFPSGVIPQLTSSSRDLMGLTTRDGGNHWLFSGVQLDLA